MTTTTFGRLRQRPWFVVALLAVLLVVVALAAKAEPGPLGEVYKTITPSPPTGITTPKSAPPATGGGSPSIKPYIAKSAPGWLIDLLRLALIVVIALLVITFVRLLVANLQGKRQQRATVEGREAGLDLDFVPDDEVVDSFAATVARLRAGDDVDDAVIHCWLGLVAAAEGSGIHRRASQTAEEFTLAVMSQSEAPSHDLQELAGLYRAAMFSTHHAGEAQRQRAIACLESLHAALAKHRAVAVETAAAAPLSPDPVPPPSPPSTWNRWGEG